MGRRRSDDSLADAIGSLIAELPEPFRSLAALWVLFTFFGIGADAAIPLLKRANQPFPWPLSWYDAVKTFNWAGFGFNVLLAVMLLGTLAAVGWVVWWRWGPGAMQRRKEARRRLAAKLGVK